MIPLRHSFLVTFVCLLVAEMATSCPPATKCRENLCVDDYRGDGTGSDVCSGKFRLLQYCQDEDDLCLAASCEESGKCQERNGYCVNARDGCDGRVITGLCKGFGCECCVKDGVSPVDTLDTDVSVCSGILELSPGESVGVYSPNFPFPYGADIDCTLSVVLPPLATFVVQPLYFDVEGCGFDVLTISTEFVNYTFQGFDLDPDTLPGDENFTITFQTDSSVAAGGFYLNVSVPSPPAVVSCDAAPVYDICAQSTLEVNTTVRLQSPNYPSFYPINRDCEVIITGPEGTTFTIEYLAFDLEPIGCQYDFLLIYDTANANDIKSCGMTPPDFPLSATNEVEVRFFSDHIVPRPGFDICFTIA